MRKLLRGLLRPNTFLPIAGTLLIFVLAQQFLARETMTIATRAIVIAMAAAIVRIYAPSLLRILRSDATPRDQYLVTGILTIWMAAAAVMVWAIAQLALDRPPWMTNHWFPNLCFVIFAASGFYFIKLPGASAAGWKYTVFVFAAAAAIVAGLVLLA